MSFPRSPRENYTMSFSETITRMWETRPPRIPSDQGGDAKVAGVAEGIGVRYQIDPTIVRIAFVVATLSVGGGVAAYLLAWLCMPRYGMAVAPIQAIARPGDRLDEVEKKERPAGWWLLIFFVLFSGVLTVGTGGLGATAVLGILALLVAWWGLHLKEPLPPAGLIRQAPKPMPRPVDLSGFTYPEGYDTPRQTPPAWDPLGTAPFAWDLPDPPPLATPKKKRPKIWLWVFAGFAVTLLVASLAVSWFLPRNYDVGEQDHAPITAEQLATNYNSDIGELTLDLRGLESLESARTVVVHPGIGETTVYLPEDVPTTLVCDDNEGLGEYSCASGRYNDDAAGAELTLHIGGGQIGELEVIPTR